MLADRTASYPVPPPRRIRRVTVRHHQIGNHGAFGIAIRTMSTLHHSSPFAVLIHATIGAPLRSRVINPETAAVQNAMSGNQSATMTQVWRLGGGAETRSCASSRQSGMLASQTRDPIAHQRIALPFRFTAALRDCTRPVCLRHHLVEHA